MAQTAPHDGMSVEMLRMHFDATIAALEKRLDERNETNAEATRTRWAANETRLHAMNQFRETLSDQAAAFITRHESDNARQLLADKAEAGLRRVADKLDADIGPLRERLEAMSRPNWTGLTGTITVLFAIVAGGYTIMGLKIDTAINPNATAIVALQEHQRQQDSEISIATNRATMSTQADMVSIGDRQQLNARMTTLEQTSSAGALDRRAYQASNTAALVEIETQFRALSHYVNTGKDSNGQLFGLLWKRVYGEDLPVTQFRPEFFRNTGNGN